MFFFFQILFVYFPTKTNHLRAPFFPWPSAAAAAGLEKEPLSPKPGGPRYELDYYPRRIKLQVSLTKLFVTAIRRLGRSGR